METTTILRFANIYQALLAHLSASSLRARLASGALWSLAGTIGGQGLQFLAFVASGRLLGRAAFGELGMVLTTVGMVGMYSGFGLATTATKHLAQYRNSDPERAGRIMSMVLLFADALSVGMLTVLLLGSGVLARAVLNAPNLETPLQIGCGFFFFNSLIGTQNGILAGFEQFRVKAQLELLRSVLSGPMMVVGAWRGGLSGALVGLVLAAGFGWLVGFVAVLAVARRHRVPFTTRGVSAEVTLVWSFALPAWLTVLSVGPASLAARSFYVQTPLGYEEMGIFSAGTRIQSAIALIGSTIGQAFLPLLSSREGGRSDRLGRGNVLLSWGIGALPALPLLALPELVGAAFGSGFSGLSANRAYTLIILTACLVVYTQALNRGMLARDRVWWLLVGNAFWSVGLVGTAYGLARFGAVGLSVAFLVGYLLNAVACIVVSARKGLVPMVTLVSVEALCIWAALSGLACLSLLAAPLSVRFFALALAVVVVGWAFWRLAGRRTGSLIGRSGQTGVRDA
ncbi:MAG: oligosaccharide flippase family protein [Polyangiaceae bacterium]|nr:oligosaccharide flippase family protein [Polyangiaceae bacterium]